MSKAKLQYQGGPMSDTEAEAFENEPLFEDIMKMRSFDEQALKPGHNVMQLEEYS
jgi:2-amino-1-hydroxyethylphosphonate dioxygenase (glycine-forming)